MVPPRAHLRIRTLAHNYIKLRNERSKRQFSTNKYVADIDLNRFLNYSKPKYVFWKESLIVALILCVSDSLSMEMNESDRILFSDFGVPWLAFILMPNNAMRR